jgi:predicted signal transduction protein with EAL and GGDEF domain
VVVDTEVVRQRLHEAVRADRIELHYQPVVDLSNGATVGVEALARWHDCELGQVPPDHFIPVAESSGLIVELGRRVLHRACREATTWSDHPDARIVVAVNVSPSSFASRPSWTTYARRCVRAACPPTGCAWR